MSKHTSHPMPGPDRSAERIEAERRAVAELDAWRAQAMPDASAPLAAEALARLVASCFATLGIDAADFSVNTVHYYRRKDILDAPAGRTSAARYDLRHVWQAAGARLAGHLGLVTLAEARSVMRGADERALIEFVAARVVDARARAHLRTPSAVRARPLPGVYPAAPGNRLITVDAPAAHRHPLPAVMIPLGDDGWCVLPAAHPAHHSPASALHAVRALAAALRVPLDAHASAAHEGVQA